MGQPKPAESREKPVLNRRWLLSNQYKWGCCGTQTEIFFCVIWYRLIPKERATGRAREFGISVRSSVRGGVHTEAVARARKSKNALKAPEMLVIMGKQPFPLNGSKKPKYSGFRYQAKFNDGSKAAWLRMQAH